MKKSLFNTRALITSAAIVSCAVHTAWAAPLYDPGLNTLPSAQGWTTQGLGPFSESVGAGRYRFETLTLNATQAGSARLEAASLNTLAGFTLDFNLRVVSEAHANSDRAGFSFIVTGQDPADSLEIAFWGDHVWACTGSFAHGVDAAFDTGTTAHAYSLAVKNNAYVFAADGAALFSAALVDYSARGAPYNLAGFVFFGDDTSSARSQVEMGGIALTPVPEPATTALLAAGLFVLAARRRLHHSRGIGLGRPSGSIAT